MIPAYKLVRIHLFWSILIFTAANATLCLKGSAPVRGVHSFDLSSPFHASVGSCMEILYLCLPQHHDTDGTGKFRPVQQTTAWMVELCVCEVIYHIWHDLVLNHWFELVVKYLLSFRWRFFFRYVSNSLQGTTGSYCLIVPTHARPLPPTWPNQILKGGVLWKLVGFG